MVTRDLSWQKDAACIGYETKLFFPEKQGEKTLSAKKVCETCPVIEECLEYAISWGEDLQGVFGGTNQRERVRIIRKRRKDNLKERRRNEGVGISPQQRGQGSM